MDFEDWHRSIQTSDMNHGELETSYQVLLSKPDASICFNESSTAAFIQGRQTCTHIHSCDPPGPDAGHTHTCYYKHAQIISSCKDERHHPPSKHRKPVSKREAVRKYREKKKVRTAYLEEEVKKLQLLNEQLLRKLQGQELLEAEAQKLRTLLLEVRGEIDDELGISPFQKSCKLPVI